MLNNFRVIMRCYNPARSFTRWRSAMLADRLRGGEPSFRPGRGMSGC